MTTHRYTMTMTTVEHPLRHGAHDTRPHLPRVKVTSLLERAGPTMAGDTAHIHPPTRVNAPCA